jgi:hypothetical protein
MCASFLASSTFGKRIKSIRWADLAGPPVQIPSKTHGGDSASTQTARKVTFAHVDCIQLPIRLCSLLQDGFK